MQLPELITLSSLGVNPGNAGTEEATLFDPAAFLKNTNPSHLFPQCSCGGRSPCTCGNSLTDEYIYAFGDIKPVLPTMSVEKEFYQVVVTDPNDKNRPFSEIAYKYLSKTENLYIARELNWIFTMRGIFDLYIIKVTTNRNLSLLIETIAPRTSIDHDIIVAQKNGFSIKENSTGAELPVITYKQIYNITDQEYVDAIVKAASPYGVDAKAAAVIFGNALSLTNNTGDQDKFRALNFIILRYMTFYEEICRLKFQGEALPNKTIEYYDLVGVQDNGVEIFGKKKVIEIVFNFQGQTSGAMKYYSCTVNISEPFPFIEIPWSIYYQGI